jgi:hypothetical protein
VAHERQNPPPAFVAHECKNETVNRHLPAQMDSKKKPQAMFFERGPLVLQSAVAKSQLLDS